MPVCLDTEGAQVRTGTFDDGAISLQDNAMVRLVRETVAGDSESFNFYPPLIASSLTVGDFISIDFNSVLVQVVETDNAGVTMRVLNGGQIGSNKAVTVRRQLELAPLTEKDVASIEIGLELGLTHFALSFANHPDDVEYIRGLAGDDAFIISKSNLVPALQILTRSRRVQMRYWSIVAISHATFQSSSSRKNTETNSKAGPRTGYSGIRSNQSARIYGFHLGADASRSERHIQHVARRRGRIGASRGNGDRELSHRMRINDFSVD